MKTIDLSGVYVVPSICPNSPRFAYLHEYTRRLKDCFCTFVGKGADASYRRRECNVPPASRGLCVVGLMPIARPQS